MKGSKMSEKSKWKSDAEKATEIVRAAGGRLVGRTRLQKTAYFLELVGLGAGFPFEYRHYGPYSEALADAVRAATMLDLLHEEEHKATWGGLYSIYTTTAKPNGGQSAERDALIEKCAEVGPIELELAATAAFLSRTGERDPWSETARLKPEKAEEGRLEKAKELFASLRAIPTPDPLPDIV